VDTIDWLASLVIRLDGFLWPDGMDRRARMLLTGIVIGMCLMCLAFLVLVSGFIFVKERLKQTQ
jgi:hypothetical protein